MKIYEYLILPGAGSRIRRLHQKILYKYAQGAKKKKKKFFFLKIGMKLPFTIKNKHRNRNLKFELQNYLSFKTILFLLSERMR